MGKFGYVLVRALLGVLEMPAISALRGCTKECYLRDLWRRESEKEQNTADDAAADEA
jgi:hypothetical protein